MKKPSRKSKPHHGSRKGASRQAARQARRASIVACDHSPVAPEARAKVVPLLPLGLELTRPVLPAIVRVASAAVHRPQYVLRRVLPESFARREWVRALQRPEFRDREALAMMSLPLVALALMLTLGLVELGRHRHPMYRGLELASATRPASLPQTQPALPHITGQVPETLAPVTGMAEIGAAGPPPYLAATLVRPSFVAQSAPGGTVAALAPEFAPHVEAQIIPKSRQAAPVLSAAGHPASLAETAMVPSPAPAALPLQLASAGETALTRLAAASPLLTEPPYPAPRMAGSVATARSLPAITSAPDLLNTRYEAPPALSAEAALEPLPAALPRLALLSTAAAPPETAPPSPLLLSLFSRYEPGSGPEYCEATPAAPRAVRTGLAAAAFGHALADAARGQTGDLVIYNDTYRHMSYPWGDVSPLYGVCTDVIIRAYRTLGVDLQQLVHESALGSGDTSIEHRRVETLRRFFTRYGTSLPVTTVAEDYQPGDVVTYYRPQNAHSKTHIAIVSGEVGPSGRYKIIHNRGWGPQSEDALFVDEITGHYRYWNPPVTSAPPITATEAKPAAPRLFRQAAARLRTDGVPARGLGH